MPDDPTDVDEVAEEFARRCRAGERPSVEEYATRYPGWADDLRAVLPAVAAMEGAKPRRPPAPAPARIPDRVGEYRVVRELGRGGMGVVYEAEHAGLGRRVALKVLPAHLLADHRVMARFRREARAAARLHHTNIVPVFEAGEADGHGFYAMQLIRGRGLDRADPGPFDHLAPADRVRAVARVGVQAADALAHAHAAGVLHRDVKPSNLLLDEHGVAWVTDFGVAKLVEEANLTQSGDLVGTIRYMPPERLDGVSDARGDVYGLGVTLFELLAGRPAFPDATPHRLVRLITDADLPRLRRLAPAVPADLETVLLKATAREPGRRYPTAAEFADDLRRFLDDRPVRARRAGPVGRGWRWARRNPALAGATAAVFVLLAAVAAVSAVAYARAAAARQEVEDALRAESAEREHAEQTADLALAGLGRAFDRFAPTRLVATPTAAAEDGSELPPAPSLPPEAVPLLEDLLRTYEPIARSAAGFPRLRGRAAEANQRIGDIRHRLGRHAEAAAAYRAAVELYEQLPAEGADRVKLARAHNDLGRVLRVLRQEADARQAHARAARVLGDAPPEFAARPECRFELARTYYALALRDALPGGPPPKGPPERPDDPAGRQAVALSEGLVRDHPTVPESRHLLACCYRDVAPGRGKGPGPPPPGPVPLFRKLVADFPTVPDYTFDLCEALARPARRGPFGPPGPGPKGGLEEAVKLSDGLRIQYPTVPEYAAAHARYTDLLGFSAYEAGDPAAAEPLHRRAIELQAGLVRRHPGVVAYAFWLALMERSLGRAVAARPDPTAAELAEARSWFESAARRLEALRQQDPHLAPVRGMLGTAYRELAGVLERVKDPSAAAYQEKAAALGPDRPPPGPPKKR